jgi:hypothetical protein
MAKIRITMEIETEDVDMAFETIQEHVECWHELLDAKMEILDDNNEAKPEKMAVEKRDE